MGKQQEHLARLNANQEGSNNQHWKGDNASYKAIHLWVRAHLPKPELCPACNLRPPREVANLDGQYNRSNLETWR